MAKLYPPYLEGTLPAFSLGNKDKRDELIIPFVLNKAVSYSEIQSAKIKIKTVQNDALLDSVRLEDCGGMFNELDSEGNGSISFFINENGQLKDSGENSFKFKIGQFYKIQLAFIDTNGVDGYYSTVGVVKCTSNPEVSIVGFSPEEVNRNMPEFIGEFLQKEGGDITEKVYSSRFDVFYSNGTLAYSSEEILHNIENNVNSYSSIDHFAFNRDIPDGEVYTIKYTVTTTNGLVKSSPEYYIANLQTYETTVKGDLKATLNYEEGYIDISLEDKTGVELSNGTYILSREDALNPGYWEELTKFSINNELVDSMILFKDFYIEQGKYYIYSLQQYNDQGVYTNRKLSNKVYSDFEDIFLYDGDKQLKLRYNPQITNFKTQLAETRTETIGSKYPFFFRNARIGYKVFPISGLLSMLSDENELFVNFDEIMRDVFLSDRHRTSSKKPSIYKHTDLLSKNMTSERLFKLEVLDWLNNGKVKLFKSPAEGNYLVRLMDISLSPEKALGRMLHNVSMTAYECDELNRLNYLKYGILREITKEDVAAEVETLREKTLDKISFKDGHSQNLFSSLNNNASTSVLRLFNLKPGTKVELVFKKTGEFINEEEIKPTEAIIVTIGATGNFIVDNITPIYGIYLIDENNGQDDYFLGSFPTISYAGRDNYKNEFNLIENIKTYIGQTRHFVGETNQDIFTELHTLKVRSKNGEIDNIDISKKEQCFCIDKINLFKRPIKYVYYDGEQYNPNYSDIWHWSDNEGFIGSETKLFLDAETKKPFTYKNMMEYAPFALYVVKNLYINDQLLSDHKLKFNKNMNYLHEIEHDYQHILEKYFIDKILMSQDAEEELLNTSLAYLELEKTPNEEISQILDTNPLFVIDGWNKKVYRICSNSDGFIYNPTFIYNEEEISLLELEEYMLNGLKPDDSNLFLNNGIYANVYYQKTITAYTLEKTIPELYEKWKELYDPGELFEQYFNMVSFTEKEKLWNKTNGLGQKYAEYVQLLTEEINQYFTKE